MKDYIMLALTILKLIAIVLWASDVVGLVAGLAWGITVHAFNWGSGV